MARVSIELSNAIAKQLQSILCSQTLATAVIGRARCVWLASQGLKFKEISQQVSLSAKTVSRWVHRFAASLDALRHVEKAGVVAQLKRTIVDCFRDAPRSGAPKNFRPTKSFRLSPLHVKILRNPIVQSLLGLAQKSSKKASCDRSCLRFRSPRCSVFFAR